MKLRMKLFAAAAAVMVFFGSPSLFAMDAGAYQKILEKYLRTGVTINGISVNAVDYRALLRERENPKSGYNNLLRSLAVTDPEKIPTREGKIAFWINAYNIGALELILKYYPVDSIRSVKISLFTYPFKKNIITVNGRLYSLDEIEHEILLGKFRMKEAHFGVNCASVSCPDLAPEVYSAENLMSLLRKQGREFLSKRGKGLRIDRENGIVHISQIFKFDSKNFRGGREVIVPFILPFVDDPADREYLKKGDFQIEFMDYSWKLNDLRFAD